MTRSLHTQENAELIQMFKHDADRALGLIFERYYQEVCSHVYRLIPIHQTCEDIAQSIFMELWQKRKELDIKVSIGAYLHRMALSRTLNYIRDNRRFAYQQEEELINQPTENQGPLGQIMEAELDARITSAIDRLPEKCRVVFVLSRFEGLSYKEIASQLDISPKTVENQISKALQMLRKAIEQ